MIPDSDIIKSEPYQGFGLSHIYSIWAEYLIKTIHKLIMDHKSCMPARATRFKYPTILWILPPGHQNFKDNAKRAKFGQSLEKSVMLFNEMRFMKLKSWDFTDPSLVVQTSTGYRFTSKGLLCYWIAIDDVVKYWVEDSTHNSFHGKSSNKQQQRKSMDRTKYTWVKPKI